jgi:hypothetical protein
MRAKKPGFYGKFIILTNGIYEETGFLGSEWNSTKISPNSYLASFPGSRLGMYSKR